MEKKNLNILLVEDSEDDAALIERKLRKNGYDLNLKRVEDREQMEKAIQEKEWDLIICDYVLPQFSGKEALKLAQERIDGVPLILVSGKIGEAVAVEMVKQGASDFVMKDNLKRLPSAVDHSLKDAQMLKEKWKIEEELRKLAHRYHLLSENVSDIIWTMDENQRFTFISPSIFKSTGYKIDEILNKKLDEFLVPEHYQLAVDAFKRAKQIFRDKKSRKLPRDEFQVRLVCKDGSTLWTESKVSLLLGPRKKLMGFLGVTRDISERKKLEKQSQEMQKMEALGTLAGGIAHDFNNTLMPIIINSELLLWDTDEEDPRHLYLKQILEAAQRGKDLVKQILTYSRHSKVEKKPVDMVRIVKEVIKFLESSLPSFIRINMSSDFSQYIVSADGIQIQQVLMNIMQNSADAIGQNGGAIEIHLSQTMIRSEDQDLYPDLPPGPYIDIAVKDNGCGVSENTAKQIFDPFFTTKRPGKGTGMGLSVAQKIIKNHQGHIQFISQQGKGSVVHIYLPHAGADQKAQEYGDDSVPRGNENLLLVEDEKDVSISLKKMLEKLGYRVIETNRARKSLDLIRENKQAFDLIIVDHLMPEMSGMDMARELKGLDLKIPVILISGYVDSVHIKRAKGLGIRKLMTKPVDTREMAQAVRKVLDSRA